MSDREAVKLLTGLSDAELTDLGGFGDESLFPPDLGGDPADNTITLVASYTDPHGDSVELYRVEWPTGEVTFTVDARSGVDTVLVCLDVVTAERFAVALTDPTAPEDLSAWDYDDDEDED